MNWPEEIEKIVDEIISLVPTFHGTVVKTPTGWNWLLPTAPNGSRPEVHLRFFEDPYFKSSAWVEIYAFVESMAEGKTRFMCRRPVWARYLRREDGRVNREMVMALLVEYLLDARLLADELASL